MQAQLFSRQAIAAIFVVAVIGVLIPGLQPQLLGALLAEGRISTAALGGLATVELLAMGMAAAGAGLVVRDASLRMIAACALAATATLDFLTPSATGGAIFAARIVAGLAEGVLIWIAIGFIIRTASPERWSGFYLAIQTLAQLGLATVLGVMAASASAGFALLGAVTLAGLAAIPWLPHAFDRLEAQDDAGRMPPARGILALLGVLLYLAFVVSVWVYVEPLASGSGIDARTIHLIAPIALGMQVVGAAAATWLAGRLPPRRLVATVAGINLGLLALMASAPSAAIFVAAVAAFGFLWLFVMPFQIPLVIAADPSRRAAGLIGGAQLTGSSLGPFAAGLLVGDTNVFPVLWFGAACAVMGVAIMIGASRRREGGEAV